MKFAIPVYPKIDPDPMSCPPVNNIEVGFVIEVDNIKVIDQMEADHAMIEMMDELQCDVMIVGHGGFIIPLK